MYEYHEIRANSWNDCWEIDHDFDFHFKMFSRSENYNNSDYLNSVNTGTVHFADGRITPGPSVRGQDRPYVVLDGLSSKSGNLDTPGWNVSTGYYPIDVQCGIGPKPIFITPIPIDPVDLR